MLGGFVTESRGEVIIKGKGVMETYWLLSKVEDIYNSRESRHRESDLDKIFFGKNNKNQINEKTPMYQLFTKSKVCEEEADDEESI